MKQTPEWNREVLLQSPLFAPLRPMIERLDAFGFPSLHDCNGLLNMHQPPITVQRGLPVRFVAQECGKLAFEDQYEPRCYLKGEVQTRERNWHDLLNALVWLTFPKAKAAINARHYQALMDRAKGEENGRGTVRDMNTLFDESGVIVVCSDTGLSALLRDFRWRELFWQRRGQVLADMGFYLFGHGLYEKAMHPYIGLTGQGLLLMVEQVFFTWPPAQQLLYLDRRVSGYLNTPEYCRSTRELTPVPLLGIPGWSTENYSPEYYDNIQYFRPGRRRN